MKFLVGITLLVAGGLSVYFLSGWSSSRMQTDEELKARFLKEHDYFVKLGQLLKEDDTLLFASPRRFHRLVGHGLVSDSEPSDEYKSAFDRNGILYGRSASGAYLKFIEFTTYRVKLDSGDFNQQDYEEKGYALMMSPPEKVQELLDLEGRYGTKFKQIEGQWYIYHGIRVSKPE